MSAFGLQTALLPDAYRASNLRTTVWLAAPTTEESSDAR